MSTTPKEYDNPLSPTTSGQLKEGQQVHMSAVVEELVPPRYPESWECCGSDCGESCVYTIYAREKEEYDRQVKLMQSFFDGDKNHESD